MNFFNQKRRHATTNKIPDDIFRKFYGSTIRKNVVMANGQSSKRHITQFDIYEGVEVLITNYLHQINEEDRIIVLKKLKEEKVWREKICNIKTKIKRILHNICYIKIVENIEPDEIHSIWEIYMVNYDCFQRIGKKLILIFFYFYLFTEFEFILHSSFNLSKFFLYHFLRRKYTGKNLCIFYLIKNMHNMHKLF